VQGTAPQSTQSAAASSAQMLSHSTKQQKLSTAQTTLQQSASLQAGVPFAEQQSPASGSPQDCANDDAVRASIVVAAKVPTKVHGLSRFTCFSPRN
jgi:hypothetical protein